MKTGATVGLIAGGVVGAVGSILLGAILAMVGSDGGWDEVTVPGFVGFCLLGTASGALVGTGIGAMVGLMIPVQPEPAGRAPRAPPEPEGPARMRRPYIACLIIQPGIAAFTGSGDPGFSLRATGVAQLLPWLAFGPEFTTANVAHGMHSFGGTVYLGRRNRVLNPYLVGNLGFDSWEPGPQAPRGDGFGSAAGAGLLWSPPRGRLQFGAESRYHWSLDHLQRPGGYEFVDFSATIRVNW